MAASRGRTAPDVGRIELAGIVDERCVGTCTDERIRRPPVMTALELHGVSMAFGGLRALDDVSFSVDEGEILGLIGPNGSGKSTAFDVISGSLTPTAGHVSLRGEKISGLPAHRIARLGIGRTFQLVRPFLGLTTRENVMAGVRFGANATTSRAAARRRVDEILGIVDLADQADRRSADLTVIERKRLEVGRALATGPSVILLDEFMAGISPVEVPEAVELVKTINAMGITVVVVEHIVKAITALCRRVVVLDAGRKLAEGPVEAVVNDPAVIAAYLGSRHAAG